MDELVLGGNPGARQRRRARANGFTPARRQRYLDALALTCNVEAAARHAGVHHTTVYHHRARDSHFREQWEEAIATACDRLELLVLEHGGAGQPMEPADPERAAETQAAPPPFDFDRAIQILRLLRGQQAGTLKRPGGLPRRATRDETTAALMEALARAQKRLEREAARERNDAGRR